jgi:hypothetical protein
VTLRVHTNAEGVSSAGANLPLLMALFRAKPPGPLLCLSNVMADSLLGRLTWGTCSSVPYPPPCRAASCN